MPADQEYRYNRLTWPEMNDAIARRKVVLLPTGSTEDHGRHLPLDVDLFLTESICLEAGRRAADRILVLPPIPFGFNLHHFDFPGTIHVEPDHFIEYCLDVTKSVAYHGFRKICIVNGHGSNGPLVDVVARKTVLETDSMCVAAGYFSLIQDVMRETLEPDVHAHAEEAETSLYLHLAGERVQMDKATSGEPPGNRFFTSDSTRAVRFNDWWGRWTTTGVHGYPQKATAEKGRKLFEAAAGRLVELVDELRAWTIAERRDQHAQPVQRHIRW